MSRINAGRVLLGGLVAGLIVTVGEGVLNGVILADYNTELAARLGMAEMGWSQMIMFVALSFLFMLVAMWLYAAARSSLGAGPGTALKIGLAVWLFVYGTTLAIYWSMGLASAGVLGLMLAWAAVEIPLAVIVGAWLYREA